MKKYVLVLAAVLGFALVSNAFAYNKISAIRIEGLKNIKAKTVLKKLKSKPNKPYSDELIKTDLKTIIKMENFSNVELMVDTNTYTVTFKVKEKPYVKKIVIKGNKKLSNGTLKQEMDVKEKEFYDFTKLEDTKAKMLTAYADKGYPDCKIETYPVTNDANNQMTLTFLIKEGNRILIGSVSINGTKAFKEKKILKQMKDTKKKRVYKQENLNKDIDEIVKFYKNNGYIQVEIGEPVITYNKERTSMSIALSVNEGIKYKNGNVSIMGNTVFTTEELQKSVTMIKGKIYKEEDFKETQQALMEMYSDKGYLGARIVPQFHPDKDAGVMNINLDITENTLIYLGKVYIDGLTSTKEYVIRREITLKEGDVFAATKVRRSMEKIQNLGFIDGVEPDILPTDKPDVMDLNMNITEGKPGMLSAGAGYSSVDQFVGTLQLSHMNLFGRAQRLNLQWEFGARKQNYQISWSEPWFMGKNMSLGLSAFNTERSRDYGSVFDAYKEGRKGGTVSVGPRFGDHLSMLFSYSYEEIRVFDIYSDTNIVPVSQTHDVTSSVSSQLAWDTRDNVFDASRGNYQALGVQLAGGPFGGNINFIKPSFKSSWYFPTFWHFILSFNGTFAMVENFGDSVEVPLYERFYIGGGETVRGYKYRNEIGPYDGGKAMSVLNVEYKFPIVRERKKNVLVGAFFADAGGCWDNAGDFNVEIGSEEKQMKSGFGFGIRFTSPVFPLRLDWGYGMNHKSGEELSQIYFTIGNVF